MRYKPSARRATGWEDVVPMLAGLSDMTVIAFAVFVGGHIAGAYVGYRIGLLAHQFVTEHF
jgi:hypothetical protein